MPLLSTPRILPNAVSAMTNFVSCAFKSCRKRPPETARAERCFRKLRREDEETRKVGVMTVSLRAILSFESNYLRDRPSQMPGRNEGASREARFISVPSDL